MICSYRHAIHACWRTEKRCFNVPCWTIATYTRQDWQVASIWISGICYPKDFVKEQANVFLDGSLPAVKFSVSMHCVKTDDDSCCKGLWVILQKNKESINLKQIIDISWAIKVILFYQNQIIGHTERTRTIISIVMTLTQSSNQHLYSAYCLIRSFCFE